MTTDQKKRALRAQINARKAITFTYQNESRTGNPYTLGTSNGKDALRVFQTQGFSKTGVRKWKFFYLEDITTIEELNTNFGIRKDYKENDESFQKIDTQVTR